MSNLTFQAIRKTFGPTVALHGLDLDVVERLEARYQRLREEQWKGRDYFGGWFERDVNNARFALVDSYEGGRCAFERLYAQAVAGEKQRLVVAIPDGEGEHAVEALEAAGAPLPPGGEDRLGVALGDEGVPLRLQLGAKLGIGRTTLYRKLKKYGRR